MSAAATIIVLRAGEQAVEVLMTRRHANLSFMGGMWVFPGGSLAASDGSEFAHGLIYDPTRFACAAMLDLQGQPLQQRECLSLVIAACRETFEESGLLLARQHDGRPCDAAIVAALQAQRAAIIKDPALFVELLLRERLRLDVESLIYWAHWITPSAVPRRFDTRFFLVAAPALQPVSTDAREATQYCWNSPTELIAASHRGEMSLPHPTLCNLIELESSLQTHGSIASLLATERHRPVPPILPKVVALEQQRMVVMPWDPEYQSSAGEGTPPHLEFPPTLCTLLPARVNHARG